MDEKQTTTNTAMSQPTPGTKPLYTRTMITQTTKRSPMGVAQLKTSSKADMEAKPAPLIKTQPLQE